MHTLQEQAYLFGRQLAFEKAATSRWREAIRSGEVSEDAANKIRQGVGFNPIAQDARLLTGAKRWANRSGFDVVTEAPEVSFGQLLRGNLTPARRNIASTMAHAGTGGGAFVIPQHRELYLGAPGYGQGMVAMHEAREAAKARKFAPEQGFRGRRILEDRPTRTYNLIPHNAEEVLNAAKAGIYAGASPDEVLKRAKRLSIPTTSHMDASLPVHDIREARLMGVDRAAENLGITGKTPREGAAGLWGVRQESGEAQEAYEASRKMTGRAGYLPRHRVKAIAAEMRRVNQARIEAPYKPAPRAPRGSAEMGGFGISSGSGLPASLLPKAPAGHTPISESVPLFPKPSTSLPPKQHELFRHLRHQYGPKKPFSLGPGDTSGEMRGLWMRAKDNRKLFPTHIDRLKDLLQKGKRWIRK